MRSHWTEIEKYLEDQKIAQELIGELRYFHMRYEVENQVKERVEKPDILFYGKKILEMSIVFGQHQYFHSGRQIQCTVETCGSCSYGTTGRLALESLDG